MIQASWALPNERTTEDVDEGTEDETQSQFLYRGAPKPSVFFRTAQMKTVCERLQAAGAGIERSLHAFLLRGDSAGMPPRLQ
jgi:hypothetical protein